MEGPSVPWESLLLRRQSDREAVQVTPQRVDLGAGLADHDAGAGGVDVDFRLAGVLADRDVRQAGVRQLVRDVVADAYVLDQEVREVALVEPVRLPVVDVAHAHGLWMDLLSHGSLVTPSASK